jgi:hypothetical protein
MGIGWSDSRKATMNLTVEMGKLPEPPNDSAPPLWSYWRHQLWQLAQSDDPHNFMKWPPIYHCMLQDHWRNSIGFEIQYFDGKNVPSWIELAMRDKHVDSSWYNLIHQAYHILRWQEATGQRIADMESIYEFGGGYGAMALVCNRLGFKGRYYIYDLPEFGLLQQWYLGECGIDNVTWLPRQATYGDVDLLIACYSLSETDFAERDRILQAWPANSYLFLYSNKFEQFDNIEYFRGLEYGEWNVSQWAHSHIDHLPPESWYTWGW